MNLVAIDEKCRKVKLLRNRTTVFNEIGITHVGKSLVEFSYDDKEKKFEN